MKIAIIGAGMAGITLGQQLRDCHDVTVFEKSRGMGGRMSTRRADPYQFDHGAQYFTARSSAFQEHLAPLLAKGVVREWPEVITHFLVNGKVTQQKSHYPRYVASPHMNALIKDMAMGIDVRSSTRIENVLRQQNRWFLQDSASERYGPFDWVVSAVPAVQAADLMGNYIDIDFASVEMQACFTVMLGFDEPLTLDWQAARPDKSFIGWMAVNSKKPLRDSKYSIVIQTTNDWAEQHKDDDKHEVMSLMLREFTALTGIKVSSNIHQVIHRWLYAATKKPLGQEFILDTDKKLAVCGDWCINGKVESAFLSGHALARQLQSV